MAREQKEIMAHKVVVGDREFILREPKIRDRTVAAQSCSTRAGGDNTVLSMMMQEELIKLLILEIDGKTVKKSEIEDLDGLLSNHEYNALSQVVGELLGGKPLTPQIELVSYSGGK